MMTTKIKLIVLAAALAGAALAAWYVQGLRADNERLSAALALSQAAVAAQASNLAAMQQASRIVSEKQGKAVADIAAMNQELNAVRRAQGVSNNELADKNNDSAGAAVLAAQLNRLFNHSSTGSN